MVKRALRTIAGLTMVLASACADIDLEPPCAVSEHSTEVWYSHLDRVDVLFVIDNSEAMEPHRDLLEQELPQMIEALVTGDFDPTDDYGPDPVPDVHIGFVSTDMGDGVPDDDAEGCSEHGDEGALHTGQACGAQDEPFVWHFPGYHDADASIATAQCNAALEPGCSVAQPLESALTALSTRQLEGGFLRSAPQDGLSLIVVVFITAQDDCSSAPSSAGRLSAVRCARNHALTHAVDRYIDGLRALRVNNEALIRTLTIAGIPQDMLVSAEGRLRDPGDHDYPTTEALLADPRMQVRVARDGASLEPACRRGEASATPARRLVELAGRLHPGWPETLHSICAEGWTAALGRVVGGAFIIGHRSAPCLSREVARDSAGLTDCRVYWTLPPWSDPEQPLTPSRCEERPFLHAVEPEQAQEGSAGAMCEVRQVSVEHDATGLHLGSGDGFFIDDDSDDALQLCQGDTPLLAFTEAARVPDGVSVRVACSDTAQHYRAPDAEAGAPAIGDPCHARRFKLDGPLVDRDARCASAQDPLLFCSYGSNVCERGCSSDSDCPPAWLCDISAGNTDDPGIGVCVNPTCEALASEAAP
jgi:hypothetical protein